MAELDETVALARSGRSADALALVRSDRGHQVMAEIRAVTDGIGAASHKRVLEEVAKLQSGAAVLRYVSLGGGLLIVIFVLGAAGATLRYMRDLIAARAEVHALNVDLERRVEARTAELTRANEEIQRFAYVVSHDLRAPLVNVMGFTSELEEGLSTLRGYFAAPQPEREVRDGAARHVVETEMPEAIGFIRSSTTKMDGLINAILRLSREGGRVLVPEPVDLGALIERQAAALRHQFEETGAKLSVPAKLPTIVSDRLALEQVFGNLIDNAVKYLAPERPGHITVRSFDQGSRVAVEIADNGRGIAPHDFDRIFELFRRSGAQDRSGEGIGLAHVRALVRRLGGEISVDSRLGEGSRFRVLLSKTLSVAPKGKAA